MKIYIILLVILVLMIPVTADAMLTVDDTDPAPVGVMDDYEAFREEKLRLSKERAAKKGLLPAHTGSGAAVNADSRLDVAPAVSPDAPEAVHENAAKETAGTPAMTVSPYISNSWQLLPLVLVPLGAVAILSALSIRTNLRRQTERRAIRKERRKQLHREIEDQFRSYFPRMV